MKTLRALGGVARASRDPPRSHTTGIQSNVHPTYKTKTTGQDGERLWPRPAVARMVQQSGRDSLRESPRPGRLLAEGAQRGVVA